MCADAHGAGVVASFPARMFVSGYAEDADSLAGTPVETVESLGSGSTTLFSYEPNFRGYTNGTAQLLYEAMLATPSTSAGKAAPATSGAGTTTVSLHSSDAHVAYEQRGKS